MRAGWAIGMVVLCIAPSVRAGENDDIARAHYATGSQYYVANRFSDAVKEFLEAYRLSPRPPLLYNIGHCYEKLDDPGRATGYYMRYLEAEPAAPERRDIEAHLFRVSTHVAKLIVHTVTDGGEIFVDGIAALGQAGEPILLTEGHHHVEVRREGSLPGALEVSLRGGLSTEVTLDARAEGAILPSLSTQTHPLALAPSSPGPQTPTPTLTAESSVVATPASPPSRRWLVWVGLAAGVLVAGAVAAIAIFASQPSFTMLPQESAR